MRLKMNHTRSIIMLPAILLLLAAGAWAQAPRTFVASTGSDSNPCSRVAPCRTFQAAVDAVALGGEVVPLDSAGFGASLTITKAVSIVAPEGVYAGITVPSGHGIVINAGPSDSVTLRGLTVIGQSGDADGGVAFNTGSELHVEKCLMTGFINGSGIDFFGPGKLFVADTISRNNNGGINVNFSPGSATVSIDHVRLERISNTGLNIGLNVKATITNSVVSGSFLGLGAGSAFGMPSELNIENCMVFNNTMGISSNGSLALVRVSNTTVTDNVTGLQQASGGVLLSRGNNTVEGNGTDTSGTIGTYMAK
jgi:hypothetical protein